MFCNPQVIDFMECCASPTFPNNVFKCGNKTVSSLNPTAGVRDAIPYNATKDAANPTANKCNAKAVNSIRVCRSFADNLWSIKPDKKELRSGEDLCGFSVYTGAGAFFAAGDPKYPNPNGIVGWGDVDGTTGDDPVLPAKFWNSAEEFFRDTRPPMLDDFYIEIVDDKEGRCFGFRNPNSAMRGQRVGAGTLAGVLALTAALLR
jgi:hypothetical protein